MGKKIYNTLYWLFCLGMAPLVMAGFFFKPPFFFLAAFYFLFLRFAWPRIHTKTRVRTLRAAVLWTEVFVVFLTLVYYSSDQRRKECDFALDPRIKPLLTYSQCLDMKGALADKCLAAILDPYALAMFRGELLVVAGRDNTTLVRIDPEKPGNFSTEDIGFGNVQQIVIDYDAGHAVMPMWKEKKRIMIYDLVKKDTVQYLTTGVTKLIGAEKSGDLVYVLSESPYLYRITLGSYKVDEFRLPYKHYNLYDIKADKRRNALFFTDWVWGLVYKYDTEKMVPDGQRFLGGVATGLALDEQTCELYVSNGIPGRIQVLDCKTLKTLRSLNVGFGGHELALSSDGSKIFLVKYFGGKFTEIDRRTGEVLFEAKTGSQTRDILYDNINERLYLCSKCGIYEAAIGEDGNFGIRK